MRFEEFITFLNENKIEYAENVLMSKNTTFRIGGPADIMVYPKNIEEVSLLVKRLNELKIKYFTLGNGSNLLVNDEGIRGVVIKTEKMKNMDFDDCTVTVGAGLTNVVVANAALERSLTGLEFAHGIPGSIGGAVIMNAGAYGGTFDTIVESTEYVDKEGRIKTVVGKEHQFGYRKSCFVEGEVVCNVKLHLKKGIYENIKQEMRSLMEKRKTSQPLEFASAGSFFKRPEGYFAGKLIEDSNLKGYTVGGAQVSEKHAGFIINRGNATYKDVEAVSDYVIKTVKENFGVELEPEVKKI